MSITKLKVVGGWARPHAAPTVVGTNVRAEGTPLPTRAPRILVGLLTGDDPPPPTLAAAQRAAARRDAPVIDPRWRR